MNPLSELGLLDLGLRELRNLMCFHRVDISVLPLGCMEGVRLNIIANFPV